MQGEMKFEIQTSSPLFESGGQKILKKIDASSGNRTRAARVAGEHSTTEPTMLAQNFIDNFKYGSYGVLNTSDNGVCSCGRVVKATHSK